YRLWQRDIARRHGTRMSRLRKQSHPNAKIPFTKASACGNDFLIVEGAYAFGDLSALSRCLCDRHRGVGADGVEWLFPDADADARLRLFNADGSEAEISGNGTRCVAAKICSREGRTEVVVRTGAGLKKCRLVGRQGSTFEFEAEMGQPEVGAGGGDESFDGESALRNFRGELSGWMAEAGGADRNPAAVSARHKCGVRAGAPNE